MKNDIRLRCPNCGAEYLPGEIYLPKYFVGQPTDIHRDCYGKIVAYDGIMMDTEEEYKCDNCNTPFIVECDMKFKTYVDEKKNFKSGFALNLKNGIKLAEK